MNPTFPRLSFKTGLLYFLCLVYFCGVVGMQSQYSAWFVAMTPLSLLLSYCVMALHHERPAEQTAWYIALAWLVGYFVEVLGVNTGFPFGRYAYGTVLGPKLWNTPMLIGVNWTIMTYCSFYMVQRWLPKQTPLLVFALVAAFAPTLIDVIIEPVAIRFGMWSWLDTGTPPLQNYLGWYVTSFVLAVFFRLWLREVHNPAAGLILALQVLFFGVLLVLGWLE
jgi:bisanhydrobacterioruberin hydratase